MRPQAREAECGKGAEDGASVAVLATMQKAARRGVICEGGGGDQVRLSPPGGYRLALQSGGTGWANRLSPRTARRASARCHEVEGRAEHTQHCITGGGPPGFATRPMAHNRAVIASRRLALFLVAAGALLAGCANNPPGQRYLVGGLGGSPGAASSSTGGGSVQNFVPIAEKFVEEHRGLKFLKPVPVTLLNDTDFTKKLNEKNKIDTAALGKQAKELAALALIDGHMDLVPLEKSLLGGAVVGFYDSESKELFVRGAQITPYTKEVMVHELTHAVQDQHFNINRPELDKRNDESAEAFLGLLEGDAVTVQNQFVASESAQDQAASQVEQLQGVGKIPTNIPQVLLEILVFPYTAGPPFISAVRSAKGQAGLDAAFTTPPTTTQQLLHPDRFLAHDAGQTVPKPPADATAIDDGILGEQGLDLLLKHATTGGNLDPSLSKKASTAWDGDHYSAWDSGSNSCVRVVFQARTPADNTALVAALKEYVATLPSAKLESTAPLTLSTCG